MPKTTRNFGIHTDKGETRIDLTSEFHVWCTVNKVELTDFLWWMHTARNNSAVIAKFAPHCLRITESNCQLVVREEILPKTAYDIGDRFVTWYIKRIEDNIVNVRLASKIAKSLKIEF